MKVLFAILIMVASAGAQDLPEGDVLAAARIIFNPVGVHLTTTTDGVTIKRCIQAQMPLGMFVDAGCGSTWIAALADIRPFGPRGIQGLPGLSDYSQQATTPVLWRLAAGSNYYMGNAVSDSSYATPGRARMYIPKAGTIKVAGITVLIPGPALPSPEPAVVWVIVYNNTGVVVSETLLSSSVTMNQLFNQHANTQLSIPVAQGDSVEFKLTIPAMQVFPAAARVSVQFLVEP